MSAQDLLQIGIDDIPINIVVYRHVDGDFKCIDLNKKAEKSEHITKEDVVGGSLADLFPTATESGLFDMFMRVYENGREEALDLDFYEDDTISGWRHYSVSRLANGDVMSVYQDLTEPKPLQAHKEEVYKGIASKLEQSEERFQVIADNTVMGIFIYHDTYVYINKALRELSGYTVEELYTMHPWEGIAEPYVKRVKETVKRRLKGERFPREHNEIKIITKNGETRTVRVMMDEMVRITDKNGIITYVNEAMLVHTGYTKEELIGRKVGVFKSGFHHKSFYEDLWDTILSGKTFKAVFTNRKKDKKLYYEEETTTPIMDTDDVIQNFVATSQDITERVLIEEKLQKLATVDSLTGIYNRYKTNEEIEIEIGRNKRYDENFALAMFDIDHFKKVNDTYGHEVGDYVLQEISNIVTNEIRESDRFGRWGGEEFMLILPKLSKKEALHVSEKLRGKIESHDFKDIGRITISIGVTVFEPSDTKESLLKRADNALYRAKNEGRNRVVFD
jgi:diguanylate cyclase (GGDEF)-like protein/PAS domain S-box-containing protein